MRCNSSLELKPYEFSRPDQSFEFIFRDIEKKAWIVEKIDFKHILFSISNCYWCFSIEATDFRYYFPIKKLSHTFTAKIPLKTQANPKIVSISANRYRQFSQFSSKVDLALNFFFHTNTQSRKKLMLNILLWICLFFYERARLAKKTLFSPFLQYFVGLLWEYECIHYTTTTCIDQNDELGKKKKKKKEYFSNIEKNKIST